MCRIAYLAIKSEVGNPSSESAYHPIKQSFGLCVIALRGSIKLAFSVLSAFSNFLFLASLILCFLRSSLNAIVTSPSNFMKIAITGTLIWCGKFYQVNMQEKR